MPRTSYDSNTKLCIPCVVRAEESGGAATAAATAAAAARQHQQQLLMRQYGMGGPGVGGGYSLPPGSVPPTTPAAAAALAAAGLYWNPVTRTLQPLAGSGGLALPPLPPLPLPAGAAPPPGAGDAALVSGMSGMSGMRPAHSGKGVPSKGLRPSSGKSLPAGKAPSKSSKSSKSSKAAKSNAAAVNATPPVVVSGLGLIPMQQTASTAISANGYFGSSVVTAGPYIPPPPLTAAAAWRAHQPVSHTTSMYAFVNRQRATAAYYGEALPPALRVVPTTATGGVRPEIGDLRPVSSSAASLSAAAEEGDGVSESGGGAFDSDSDSDSDSAMFDAAEPIPSLQTFMPWTPDRHSLSDTNVIRQR